MQIYSVFGSNLGANAHIEHKPDSVVTIFPVGGGHQVLPFRLMPATHISVPQRGIHGPQKSVHQFLAHASSHSGSWCRADESKRPAGGLERLLVNRHRSIAARHPAPVPISTFRAGSLCKWGLGDTAFCFRATLELTKRQCF
jgi:hypothetical protein